MIFGRNFCTMEMCMERITSKSNKIVKDTKKLITSSKARKSSALFVLEGARLCFDVLNSVYKVKWVLITDKAYEKYADKAQALMVSAETTYLISSEVAEKLSDTENTQGIFAVCEIMKGDTAPSGSKLIALDNVQDPANLGTIIRTAEALGIDGIIAYNCCDIYNPKTLRASMGGVLRMGVMSTDNLEETLCDLQNRYRLYATVPDSGAENITDIDFTVPSICVIGNEANGVEENIKAISDSLITIPMLGRAESLNAGVAAAITMWEMLR